MTFVIVVVLMLALAGAGFAAIAQRQKQHFAKANEIVPGRPTAAPPEWAGAHSPEAKLHRRIGAAVSALRANATLADGAFMEARASIEQVAIAIDERLIAAAALPASHRTTAVAAIEPDVAALEASVASLATSATAGGTGSQVALDASISEARQRLDALDAARSEIDRLDVHGAAAEETAIEAIQPPQQQQAPAPPATNPSAAPPQTRPSSGQTGGSARS